MCAKQNTVPKKQGRGQRGSAILVDPVMPGRITPLEHLTKTSEPMPNVEGMSLQSLSSISNNSAENTITSQTKEKLHQAILLTGSSTK